MSKIILGVSSCLMGNTVRHDGGHKRNVYILSTLAEYFDFRTYCPEMAIGLGVPRPTIRLTRSGAGVRLTDSDNTGMDLTDAMNRWSGQATEGMRDLSGFILKNNSPSCGMERVRVYDGNGAPTRDGVGLFASALMQAMPWLPVEEEGRLNDPMLRENFIERVFVYYRWQRLIEDGLTVASLMEFHKRHKFILLAHNEEEYRQLGPLIAGVNNENIQQVADEYLQRLMKSLAARSSRKRHTNVLMHVMGFLKNRIDSDDKQEMMRHHLRRFPDDYISSQYYMNPYPEELMLRNSI
jgi:uncharacterized protein YbgA (DUF1722 family)/uncharacterized protein YbbK (DUF523 family)